MSARGFSLIELLIAAALLMAITGALAALVSPLGAIIDRAHASADMDSGTRTAVQQLTSDLREAGSDAGILASQTRFARLIPAVVLLRDLDDNEAAVPASAVRVTFVPHLAAQGTLAVAATAGDTVLWLDTEVRCATGHPSCGFRAGQRAVLSTGVSASSVAIERADEGTVTLASPLPAAFPAGAVLAELLTVTYGVRHGGDGSSRLVRITSGGAEQPVLDNLVEFTVSTDSGDPVAPARLFVTLRVQAPSERLRGPAGYLFRHAGTATHGRRWIPDVEIRTAVAVRNGLPSW